MRLKALKERRYTTIPDKGINVRSEQTEAGERYIEGYAALFIEDSKLIAEYCNNKPIAFIERILPGAFDEALESKSLNVIHTIDHDRTKMVARTASGTLQLSVDEKGLMQIQRT
ncbi:MAG: HK97 family phage prohead protease [Cyclobacteriaceae bacterium]